MGLGFLESYSNDVAVLSNVAIPFNSNVLTKGKAVTQNGANTFVLNECGLYHVIVSVSGAVTDTAGNIVIELMKDGVLLEKTIQQAYSGTALTADVNITLDSFISNDKVNTKCCCSTGGILQVMNVGNGTTFENVHITIEKVGCTNA